MYSNYQYSLSDADQSMIQVFLRTLSPAAVKAALGGEVAWRLLHDLTYANAPEQPWSQEPLFSVKSGEAPETK